MVLGLCCDSSSSEWTIGSERRTGWKPELAGCLWADEIHSGTENWEEDCAYIHVHTHSVKKEVFQMIIIWNITFLHFAVKIGPLVVLEVLLCCAMTSTEELRNSQYKQFTICWIYVTAFPRWPPCPAAHWKFLETAGICEWLLTRSPLSIHSYKLSCIHIGRIMSDPAH